METEFFKEIFEDGLFFGGEGLEGGEDTPEVFGEDGLDEGSSIGGQGDGNEAAVVGVLLAFNEAALFEVIDDEGHIAGTFKDFLSEGFLAHRAEEVEGFEGSELTDGEMDILEMFTDVGTDGVGGAHEFNIGVESADFLSGTRIMCTHKDLALNNLILN